MNQLLSVENLETVFFTKKGPLKALDNINYTIGKGETVGIVGESGCGKSVTSLSIMGLVPHPGKITKGSVRLESKDLVKLPSQDLQKIRGDRISMIFQEPMTALNPVYTIGWQIVEQILAHQEMTRADALDKAVGLLKQVGIPSPERRIHDYPHQLSGGMRQRAMIAMALSCEPDLLIADEPTTALDVTIQAQILDLLLELQEVRGMAIQFITHDLGVVSEVSQRVIVMYAGSIVETGKAQDILTNPRHPYTVGLLSSRPKLDENVDKLKTIEGVVPSLDKLPVGCAFQNRCSRVDGNCKDYKPSLTQYGDNFVACFNPVT
jgi:peptide/nickel transport system ATP-binding protein